MFLADRWSSFAQMLKSWNWKCALMSATARSLVYLAALHRYGAHGAGSVVLVEIGYVTLTAGVYAGMQQQALRLRSHILGYAIVVVGVPMLAQMLDWAAHKAVGAPVAARATLAVSIFATVSALFHLHVMRNGVFVTDQGRTLFDDFRRIPRLIQEFLGKPFVAATALARRMTRPAESEAA